MYSAIEQYCNGTGKAVADHCTLDTLFYYCQTYRNPPQVSILTNDHHCSLLALEPIWKSRKRVLVQLHMQTVVEILFYIHTVIDHRTRLKKPSQIKDTSLAQQVKIFSTIYPTLSLRERDSDTNVTKPRSTGHAPDQSASVNRRIVRPFHGDDSSSVARRKRQHLHDTQYM
jgi:hypothetical protein